MSIRKKIGVLYENTKQRSNQAKKLRYNLVEMWECNII